MRCNKAREYISRELDALLPPDATGKLRDHLDGCAECREFRADILLGQRLLSVTEPKLPDNFEWKLQLRLNQALQQAAGEHAYPWPEERVDRWAAWRNFGAASAVGLAAVLALAMFFGPVSPGQSPQSASVAHTMVGGSDRLPLFQPGGGGLSRQATQLPVSTAGAGASRRTGDYLDRGWSGTSSEDLITIYRLRAENQRLSSRLLQYQRVNEMMRAQLDTSAANALDLEQVR